jgi:hypothetical protein
MDDGAEEIGLLVIPKASKQQCCVSLSMPSFLSLDYGHSWPALPLWPTESFIWPTYQVRRKQKYPQAEVFTLPKRMKMLRSGCSVKGKFPIGLTLPSLITY